MFTSNIDIPNLCAAFLMLFTENILIYCLLDLTMLKLSYSIAFLFIFSGLTGQNVSMPLRSTSPLSSVQRVGFDHLDNNHLVQKYRISKSAPGPKRFAEPIDVDIRPEKDGSWETVEEGFLVWRIVLESRSAHSLNLGFSDFVLPGSAQLFIYNELLTEVLGPFTQKDNDDHRQLWTPIVTGDAIVVELRVTAEEKDEVYLRIGKLNHDFTGPESSVLSGACNLDVICGEEDGWEIIDAYRDVITSVGAYSYNGIDQCTGVLINNTGNDCTPYFLTADHCGITNNNSPTIVVYWNFENSFCRQPNSSESGQPGDGIRTQFNSGASLRANFAGSDFALIELDDPLEPDFRLYMAGWDRSRVLPDSSVCIHHPGVEEKRISFNYDPLLYDESNGDTTNIRVDNWELGTTEGGSSGSPIFNPDKLVIGQLQGGLAACGNDEYDTYGWFRRSWEGGGTPGSRLKDWLDPLGMDPMRMTGRSCSYVIQTSLTQFQVCTLEEDTVQIAITAAGAFDSIVNLSVSELPGGLTAEFTDSILVVGDTSTLMVSGLAGLNDTTFTFDITGVEANNQAAQTVSVSTASALPGTPILSAPENQGTSVSLAPLLEFTASLAISYTIDLSPDSLFANDVTSFVAEDETFQLTGLKEDTKYFWRVRALNFCGESMYSDVFNFTTSFVFCTSIASRDVPLSIGEQSGITITSDLEFPYPVSVEDVDVQNVSGNHSYISDLRFALKFGGSETNLMNNICEDEDDFSLGFDDESLFTDIPCPPVDTRLYVPLGRLDIFEGMNAEGIWSLEVTDDFFLDGGSLNAWSMTVCYSNPQQPVVIPDIHNHTICANDSLEIRAFVDMISEDPDELFLVTISGDTIFPDITGSLRSGQTVILTMKDFSLLEPGENTLTLMARSQNEMATAQVDINLKEMPPQATITSPSHNDTFNISDVITIIWDPQGYSGPYILEVSLTEDFSDLVVQLEGEGTTIYGIPSDRLNDGQEYFIRLIHPGDCGSSISETTRFFVRSTVSTATPYVGTLTIFPNPSSTAISVEWSGSIQQSGIIEVLELSGKKVMTHAFNHRTSLDLEITELPDGVYLLVLASEEFNYVGKVIKL